MIKMSLPSEDLTAIKEIVKRDGRCVPFSLDKITTAIQKAFTASKRTQSLEHLTMLSQSVAQRILEQKKSKPSVEEIQDIVEQVLMENGHVQTAKKYILYRADRTRAREMNTSLMKTFGDITFKDSKTSDIKRENANVNGDTPMGQMLKYGSEGAKEFFHKFILKPEFSQAHLNGDIHIHDLDFYTMTTTCTQIDIQKLFHNGFSTGHGVLREPNDIQSYAALACIAIQSNQNDQHGGQSIPNFDYGLAPGVTKTFRRLYRQNLAKSIEIHTMSHDWNLDARFKKMHKELFDQGLQLSLGDYEAFCDKERERILADFADGNLNEAELKTWQTWAVEHSIQETDRATFQAMEALVHNLNTMHSRAGAQTPFSSINYGTDTSPEGQMVSKNILLAHEAGLGTGETPIFPIHVFRVKEGINTDPGDPNYELFQLACRVSAKRLFPNFAFQDAPFNMQFYDPKNPETEIAYMGCRTRVIGNVHDTDRQISYSRGNLSFTSINLPRIAIRSNGNLDWFFEELDRKMTLCIEQVLERFKIQCTRKVRNYPFLMGQGVWLGSEQLKMDDEVGEVLKHGTLSIGFIGLAETLKVLTGMHHGESECSQNLGLEIVTTMKSRLDEESRKRKLNFTLLATPAEGLSGRFIRMDREEFGEIDGVTDREYYTNSFHVPVYYPVSAWKKIQLEAPYHALTNAGHITYVEMDGDISQNPEAFEKIVHAMRKAGIGYGAINHPIDHDPVCGFNGIIEKKCPKCGREEGDIPFERVRRITGYLVGTLERFNDAKRAEVRDRVPHQILDATHPSPLPSTWNNGDVTSKMKKSQETSQPVLAGGSLALEGTEAIFESALKNDALPQNLSVEAKERS